MWIDGKGSIVLPVPECKRLLAVAAKDGQVGRLGMATDGFPAVTPVNFGLRQGHIVIRVGPGFLTETAAGHRVAFEVDHVDREAGTAWSVLVRGLANLIESPAETDLTAADPLVPEPGDMLLTIRPDVLTGRCFDVRRDNQACP